MQVSILRIISFSSLSLIPSSHQKAIDYYFKDGQNSAQILLNLITSLYPPTGNPIKLLEFASGYGCVTRHLLNLQANLSITACDIHEEAISFIENKLNNSSILSHPEPEQLKLDSSTYDIVFVYPFSLICLIQLGFVGCKHCITLFHLVVYSFSQPMVSKQKYFGFPNLNEKGVSLF